MAIDTITPAADSVIENGAALSFKVDDTYTTLTIECETSGGYEYAYDSALSGTQTGYVVTIVASGGRHTFTVTRTAGWDLSPFNFRVVENETGSSATTTTSYALSAEQPYPQGQQPYNAAGVAANVTSFEGRTGPVVAVVSDYDASEIDNDSGVTGTYVSDALDTLEAVTDGLTTDITTKVEDDGTHIQDALYLQHRTDHVNTPGADKGELWLDQYEQLTFTNEDNTDRLVGLMPAASWINNFILMCDSSDGEMKSNTDFQYSSGKLYIRGTTASVAIIERAAGPTVGAGYCELWVKDDSPSSLYFTDDDATDKRINTTLSGTGNPGATTGNGYGLGTIYVDTTNDVGYTLVDATVGANVWSSGGGGDVVGPASATNRAVALWDGATGKLLKDAGTLSYGGLQANTLALGGGTGPAIAILETGTAPSNSAGYGKYWVKDDAPTTPWFTDDATGDYRLLTAAATGTTDCVPFWSATGHLEHDNGFRFASSPDNMLYINGAGSSIRLAEAASLAASSFAGYGHFWVRNDAPTSPMFTDDAGGDHRLLGTTGVTAQDALYFTERADHVNTPGAGKAELWVKSDAEQKLIFTDDEGHDQVVYRSDGSTPLAYSIPFGDAADGASGQFTQSSVFGYLPSSPNLIYSNNSSALRLGEGTSGGTPGAGKGSFWVRNDAPNVPMFTDDVGTDFQLGVSGSGDVVGPASATSNALVRFNGTTGKIIRDTSGLTFSSGLLNIDSATATIKMGESASAPANAAGKGQFWVKDDSPTTPWFTDDVSGDYQLGDVVGPASAGDDRIATFDTTSGKLIQDTAVAIEQTTGVITNVGTTAMLVLAEQTGSMPSHSAGYGKIWVDNTAPTSLMFTDDVSTDHPVVLAPTSVGNDRLLTWDGTTGHYVQSTAAALTDNGALVMTGSTVAVEMAERSSAPSNSGGYGKFWVKNDAPTIPMFTDDVSGDSRILTESDFSTEVLGTIQFQCDVDQGDSTPASGSYDCYVDNLTATSTTYIRFSDKLRGGPVADLELLDFSDAVNGIKSGDTIAVYTYLGISRVFTVTSDATDYSGYTHVPVNEVSGSGNFVNATILTCVVTRFGKVLNI